MPDLQKLKESILKAEAALAEARRALSDEPVAPPVPAEQESFENLKEVLMSDKWPVAANKTLVCDPDNETDKVERSRGVVELMIEGDLTGKKFLDFGCGEGHSAAYVSTKGATLSVGFDINSKGWENRTTVDNFKLTQNWDDVVANGPYDYILVFDVLDHIQGTTPTEALKKLRAVLSDTGRIYVRTHPFTARHAMHNYHHLNKGYIHLVFTPEETEALLEGGKHVEPNIGVKLPLATYKKWFEDSNLEIVNSRPVKDTVEPFFKTPAIANRINKNLGFDQFPEFQMGMQFIDYSLKKSEIQ